MTFHRKERGSEWELYHKCNIIFPQMTSLLMYSIKLIFQRLENVNVIKITLLINELKHYILQTMSGILIAHIY